METLTIAWILLVTVDLLFVVALTLSSTQIFLIYIEKNIWNFFATLCFAVGWLWKIFAALIFADMGKIRKKLETQKWMPHVALTNDFNEVNCAEVQFLSCRTTFLSKCYLFVNRSTCMCVCVMSTHLGFAFKSLLWQL